MTLIARQQSAGGHEPVFRSHSRACAALESGGPWKASRRDETSFFATASKKPVDLAVWATKPGQGSLDGTLSHAAWKCVPRCVEFCTTLRGILYRGILVHQLFTSSRKRSFYGQISMSRFLFTP